MTAVILVLLALAGTAAFLLVDFRVLNGEFTAERQVTTTTAGIDPGHPLPLEVDLDVYILGDGSAGRGLGEKLANALETKMYFGNVRLHHELPQPVTESLLVVDVTERNLLWTPLYSRSDLTIRLAYASDGQVDWDNPRGTVSLVGDQPVAHIQGSYGVRDTATGLMSLPGYRSYLTDKIASEISQDIDTALSSAGH